MSLSERSSARPPQAASSSSNQIWLFFAAILLMGVASRTQESIFSSFLADTFNITAVAGAIWLGFGYQRVFLAGACLAVVISCLASMIPPKPRAGVLPRKRTSRTTGTKGRRVHVIPLFSFVSWCREAP